MKKKLHTLSQIEASIATVQVWLVWGGLFGEQHTELTNTNCKISHHLQILLPGLLWYTIVEVLSLISFSLSDGYCYVVWFCCLMQNVLFGIAVNIFEEKYKSVKAPFLRLVMLLFFKFVCLRSSLLLFLLLNVRSFLCRSGQIKYSVCEGLCAVAWLSILDVFGARNMKCLIVY